MFCTPVIWATFATGAIYTSCDALEPAAKARWLFITLISRVFIELGDTIVGLLLDRPTANTSALLALATVELCAVFRLWKVIRVDQGRTP